MLLTMALPGGDLEAALSTQEPKKSSPSQGTTSATSGMTEEELEEYVVVTKVEMSAMENTMANSNYTGMFIMSCVALPHCRTNNIWFVGVKCVDFWSMYWLSFICLVHYSLLPQAAAVGGCLWSGGTSPSLVKRKAL